MLNPPDQATAIFLTRELVALAAAITALEFIALRSEVGDRGLSTWRVLRDDLPRSARVPLALASPVAFSPHGVAAIAGAKLAGAVGLLVFAKGDVAVIPLTVIALSTLLLHARFPYGLDGSDQMALLVIVALWLQSFQPEDTAVGLVTLSFIAAQGVLAYFVAGVAKLSSSDWRNGRAIWMIFRTDTYGLRSVKRMLRRVPFLWRPLAWFIILFECSFPLAVVLGPNVAIAAIALAVAFHVGTAVVMGLNTFLWAFAASYPALLFVSAEVQQTLAS